jgi:lysophospholipase L1-like esterase
VAGAPVVETDDIHPNGQGYQVVADAVAQFLSAYEVQAQQTAAGSAHGQQ